MVGNEKIRPFKRTSIYQLLVHVLQTVNPASLTDKNISAVIQKHLDIAVETLKNEKLVQSKSLLFNNLVQFITLIKEKFSNLIDQPNVIETLLKDLLGSKKMKRNLNKSLKSKLRKVVLS